jgi:hypothetical protein
MKALKLASTITALVFVFALGLGNIFHNQIRKLVDKNYIFFNVRDNQVNQILNQRHPEYWFNIATEKNSYYPYQRILVYGKIARKDDMTVPAEPLSRSSSSRTDGRWRTSAASPALNLFTILTRKSGSATGIQPIRAFAAKSPRARRLPRQSSIASPDREPFHDQRKTREFYDRQRQLFHRDRFHRKDHSAQYPLA